MIDSNLIDLSNYDDATFDPACFYAAGIRRAIVGCQRLPIARRMVPELRAAGIEVIGLYGFVYFNSDLGRTHEIENAIAVAAEFGIDRIWVDCEADARDQGWTTDGAPSVADRVRQIETAVLMIEAAGATTGIYTGSWWWPSRTGNSQRFSRLPLWHSDYGANDGHRAPVATVGYGGWSDVAIHQYQSTWNICGRVRDRNYLFEEDKMSAEDKARLARLEALVAGNGYRLPDGMLLTGEAAMKAADEDGSSLFLGLGITQKQLAEHSHAGEGPHTHHAEVTLT